MIHSLLLRVARIGATLVALYYLPSFLSMERKEKNARR